MPPQMEPPPHLDYQTPSAQSHRRIPFTSIGITLYLGVIVALTLVNGWFILPRFEQALMDFGTSLPAITVIYLSVARWLARFPGVLVLMAIPLVAPHLITRAIHRTDNPAQVRVRVLWAYLLITIFAGVVVLLTILAVILPMVQLIQSVSSPKGGGG